MGQRPSLPSFPRPPHRPSRVSGNPKRYCLMTVLSTGNRWIPAYAGMTVEIPIPLILNLLKDVNGGGKRRRVWNGGGPSFNKFRMSGWGGGNDGFYM